MQSNPDKWIPRTFDEMWAELVRNPRAALFASAVLFAGNDLGLV